MKGWSVIQWIAAVLVICGIIAILKIALAAMGVPIPPWLIDMAWVVLIVVAALAFIGLIVMVWRSWSGPPSP